MICALGYLLVRIVSDGEGSMKWAMIHGCTFDIDVEASAEIMWYFARVIDWLSWAIGLLGV